MTLKEVIDASLALPDEATMKKNMDFLQNTLKNLSGDEHQKMQAVIDGLKKTDLFLKAKKEEQQQQKQPPVNTNTAAQQTNTGATAQISNTKQTAQISNN